MTVDLEQMIRAAKASAAEANVSRAWADAAREAAESAKARAEEVAALAEKVMAAAKAEDADDLAAKADVAAARAAEAWSAAIEAKAKAEDVWLALWLLRALIDLLQGYAIVEQQESQMRCGEGPGGRKGQGVSRIEAAKEPRLGW